MGWGIGPAGKHGDNWKYSSVPKPYHGFTHLLKQERWYILEEEGSLYPSNNGAAACAIDL